MRNDRNKKTTRDARDTKKTRPIRYTYVFKVNRSTTLLELLLSKIKLSRNSVKGLLGRHMVLVNGAVVTQFDYPLAKDDEVKVADKPVPSEVIKKAPKNKRPKGMKLSPMVIYEDDIFVAINKPSGLLSVESDTKRESAYTYCADYLKAIDPKMRPYTLHRIDRDTSGVLVFCKDIKIQSKLRTHWNQDIKLREYYAVVSGKLEEKDGTLTTYLMENQNNVMYATQNRRGKKAITNYEVISYNKDKDYSLLRVTIDTGRKNQIRVMMAEIGHPVVGDEKYGDGRSPFGRLGLHASELDFIHPETRKIIKLKAPLPKEFTALFESKKR